MKLSIFSLTLPILLSPTLALPSSPILPRHNPTPTLPFTAAAFQSPGTNPISGVRLRAFGGSLWINPQDSTPRTDCAGLKGKKCPPGNETVFWVDEVGQAWLDSVDPQQVYINTQTGVLSYLANNARTFPPGAITVNFLHLGSGTSVTSPLPPGNPPGLSNAGPSTFNWLGSSNDFWFLCPRPGPGYQVMKFVGGNENWNACVSGVQLVALDYSGPSPAAGEYL